MRNAWRSRELHGVREYAETIDANASDPLAPPVAGWGDEVKYTIVDITSADLESMRSSRRSGGASKDTIKIGMHADGQVTVTTIPDRGELAIIKLCGKQICQVKTSVFEDRANAERAAREHAIEFMKCLATELVEGKVEVQGIYKRRDEKLVDLQIVVRKRLRLKSGGYEVDEVVMKKPAKRAMLVGRPPSATTISIATKEEEEDWEDNCDWGEFEKDDGEEEEEAPCTPKASLIFGMTPPSPGMLSDWSSP